MSTFSDKVIIITGAGSGIGEGAAIYFAKLGASLVLVGRNIENLNNTLQQCLQQGNSSKAIIVRCDINDEDAPKQIIESTIEQYGKLNILINNAGVLERDSIETIKMEIFDKIITTNLRSVIRLTQAAIPYLIKSKGVIINNSSYLGGRSVPSFLSYGITKAALNHFTQCIAMDLAPKGVRVNSVNPGFIPTNLNRRLDTSSEQFEQIIESSRQQIPLGRVGSVEDTVNAIGFLAGEQSSFMTGVLLPVDGGKHAATIQK